MRSAKYFSGRFKQVPDAVINTQYRKNYWVLDLLDSRLEDPAECGTKFFHFLVAKCLEVGQTALTQVTASGVELYQFIQEHEKRKREKNDREKSNSI